MSAQKQITPIHLYLVKPYPPGEIRKRHTPLPEEYKYNWEPVTLKILAYFLEQAFPGILKITIWHFMHPDEENAFLIKVREEQPLLVAFTELDILVNTVNHLSRQVKSVLPGVRTVVGGKQSSLLCTGDLIPFTDIDYIIGGDGIQPLILLVRSLLEAGVPGVIPGLLQWDKKGVVTRDSRDAVRYDITRIDGKALRKWQVVNHPMEEYIEQHQKHPALVKGKPVRTVPLFSGNGCPYDCYFCQSPRDYGEESSKVLLRSLEDITDEVEALVKTYNVNNFFLLESNLNLDNLLQIYQHLGQRGIGPVAFSGFIRAADIVKAHKDRILVMLKNYGVRFLSIGLDISLLNEEDIYNKEYSYSELLACLAICKELGILLFTTFVGNPAQDRKSFRAQLEIIKGLPVADIDVRLAIALRHTAYYEAVKTQLIYAPPAAGKGAAGKSRYFDHQNYRYQTIRFPGKITPRQSYSLVKAFYREFFVSGKHIEYVTDMINSFPETASFFREQYTAKYPAARGLKGRGLVLYRFLESKE